MAETTRLAPHIVSTPGVRGGRPCIEGKGVAVAHVAIMHERLAWSADELCDQHDLTLAEVHAALAYYFDHRDEIDQRIREDEAYAEEMSRQAPVSSFPARPRGVRA